MDKAKTKALIFQLVYHVVTYKTFLEKSVSRIRDVTIKTAQTEPFKLVTSIAVKDREIAKMALTYNLNGNITFLTFQPSGASNPIFLSLTDISDDSVYESFKQIESHLPIRKGTRGLWSSIYKPCEELKMLGLEDDTSSVGAEFREGNEECRLTINYPGDAPKNYFDWTAVFEELPSSGATPLSYRLDIQFGDIVKVLKTNTAAETKAEETAPNFNEVIANKKIEENMTTNTQPTSSPEGVAQSTRHDLRFVEQGFLGGHFDALPEVILNMDQLKPIALSAVELAGMTGATEAERLRVITLAVLHNAMVHISRSRYRGFTSTEAYPALQRLYSHLYSSEVAVTRKLTLYEVARFIEVNLPNFFRFEPEDLVEAKTIEL